MQRKYWTSLGYRQGSVFKVITKINTTFVFQIPKLIIMASNVFTTNAYQINQRIIPLVNVVAEGFPTTGVLLQDCINSPTRSLSTGVNAYSAATVLATNTTYYFRETFAQLVALVNA